MFGKTLKKNVNAERYNCFGAITAFTRDFLSRYRLPETKDYYTEDTYSFYYAKKNKFQTVFVRDAIAYFKLPTSLREYINQMSRYLSTEDGMRKMFGDKLLNKYETITPRIKYFSLLNYGFKRPLYMFSYVIIQMLPKLNKIIFRQKTLWKMISSSKKLNTV